MGFFCNANQLRNGTNDHKGLSDSETVHTAMTSFRSFLESKATPLTESNACLVFYALPYVSNPKDHPTFKDIFTDKWISELNKRMASFVENRLRKNEEKQLEKGGKHQGRPQPRLVDLYYCNDGELNDVRREFTYVENRLNMMEKQWAAQQSRFSSIQEGYRRLTTVTAELISALESAVQGNFSGLDSVLASCSREFPDLFAGTNLINQSQHELHGSRGPDSQSDVSFTSGDPDPLVQTQRALHHIMQTASMHNYATDRPLSNLLAYRLNYAKIKHDIINADVSHKCRLMQALRWQLTRTLDTEDVLSIVTTFISHDLLGCFKRHSEYSNRVVHLLRSPNASLQEAFSRFINAFVSFTQARAYIQRHPQLVAVTVDCVKGTQQTTTIHDMLLGALQKLSLRRALQQLMVDLSVLEWLSELLLKYDTESPNLSAYALEYASALFMNLSLHPAGRDRCIAIADNIIALARNLLKLNINTIMPYINGAIYSLLTVDAIKTVAIESDLETLLRSLQESQHADNQRQIEFILDRLTSSENADDIDSGGTTSDCEDDEETLQVEPEIDANDPVPLEEPSGEEFLRIIYTAHNNTLRRRKSSRTSTKSTSNAPSSSAGSTQGGAFSPPRLLSLRHHHHTLHQGATDAALPLTGEISPLTAALPPVEQPPHKKSISPDDRPLPALEKKLAAVGNAGAGLAGVSGIGAVSGGGGGTTTTITVSRDDTLDGIESSLLQPSLPPVETTSPKPNRKITKFGLHGAKEYSVAFVSRPRIPRTPESGT